MAGSAQPCPPAAVGSPSLENFHTGWMATSQGCCLRCRAEGGLGAQSCPLAPHSMQCFTERGLWSGKGSCNQNPRGEGGPNPVYLPSATAVVPTGPALHPAGVGVGNNRGLFKARERLFLPSGDALQWPQHRGAGRMGLALLGMLQ